MTSESWVLCHADTLNFGPPCLDFITSLDLSWFPIRPQLVPHDLFGVKGFPMQTRVLGGRRNHPHTKSSSCEPQSLPGLALPKVHPRQHYGVQPCGCCLGDQDGVILPVSSLEKWCFSFFGLALRCRKFCNCCHSGYNFKLLTIIFHIHWRQERHI